MAQSRLEKIGTIFSRVTGLLRSGAMKQEDKPLWYEVYESFPPKQEPRFDRPIPNMELKKIFYEDDIIRAKYHKLVTTDVTNLSDKKYKTNSQQFIEIYKNLKDQGPINDEKIVEVALEMLQDKNTSSHTNEPIAKIKMVEDFTKAQISQITKDDKPTLNIKDLFKE